MAISSKMDMVDTEPSTRELCGQASLERDVDS